MGGDVDYLFGGGGQKYLSMNTFQCILKLSFFFVEGTIQFQNQHKNLTSMYFLSKFEIFESIIFYLNETIKMITYQIRN